jgi:hypothetical protein
MAIDTAKKRFAILTFGIGSVPYPSGSIDEGARATLIGNYYIARAVITTPSWRQFVPEAKSRSLFVGKDDRELDVPAILREVDFGRQNKQVVLP